MKRIRRAPKDGAHDFDAQEQSTQLVFGLDEDVAEWRPQCSLCGAFRDTRQEASSRTTKALPFATLLMSLATW
jgi:hypothetical protein